MNINCAILCLSDDYHSVALTLWSRLISLIDCPGGLISRRTSGRFSMPKSEVIGEIVRQGRVRDFMEHMLNRGRTRTIRTRRNIYFSARFCPSVGLNESESFGFLRVLQPGMKSFSTRYPSSHLPRVVFVSLPNYFLSSILQTLPRRFFVPRSSSFFFFRSTISFVLVFTPCVA